MSESSNTQNIKRSRGSPRISRKATRADESVEPRRPPKAKRRLGAAEAREPPQRHPETFIQSTNGEKRNGKEGQNQGPAGQLRHLGRAGGATREFDSTDARMTKPMKMLLSGWESGSGSDAGCEYLSAMAFDARAPVHSTKSGSNAVLPYICRYPTGPIIAPDNYQVLTRYDSVLMIFVGTK